MLSLNWERPEICRKSYKIKQDTFRQEIEELEQSDTHVKLADAKGQLENAWAWFLEDKEILQYQIADEG
jgi:hypothetical protein